MNIYDNKFKIISFITIPLLYVTGNYLKKKINNQINYNKNYKQDTLIFKNIDPNHFTFLIKNIKEQTKDLSFKKNIYILCQEEYMVKIPYTKIQINYNNKLYNLDPLLNKYSNIIGYKISTYDDNLDSFIIDICSKII
tara:strand:+ start:697 stop:1110 length:414 start_codon:yes stop_codon:yes gene_type:complete